MPNPKCTPEQIASEPFEPIHDFVELGQEHHDQNLNPLESQELEPHANRRTIPDLNDSSGADEDRRTAAVKAKVTLPRVRFLERDCPSWWHEPIPKLARKR